MFREMRRNKQELSLEECKNILETASNGVLGVLGDEGYPYTVPLSFVFYNNKIYFHSAKEGHKIDAIKKEPKVSFCIVNKDNVIPEKFTTSFESVIVFGKARILEKEEEIIDVLKALSKKYSPMESAQSVKKEIAGSIRAVTIVEIECESITGKKSRI